MKANPKPAAFKRNESLPEQRGATFMSLQDPTIFQCPGANEAYGLVRPLKRHECRAPFGTRAFTLIELLVVIAVIALLAAMVIPISGVVNRVKILKRCQAERLQIESFIDSY